MNKAKELLIKIKAMFDEQTLPPAPAPLAPPAGTPYTLQDGATIINIVQAGDTPAVGDMVTINGAPAPANTYTLQDGSTLVTDATGAITAYTAGAPVTVDPLDASKAAPAAPAAKFEATPAGIKAAIDKMTPETMAAMFDAFATGTPEERLANLEVVCKALMEYNFGWQIREQQQKATTDQAINIYKQDLVSAQAAMAKQDQIITRQGDTVKAMFELMEQLAAVPSADPATIPEHKKERFEKQKSKEDRLEILGKAIGDLKRQPA